MTCSVRVGSLPTISSNLPEKFPAYMSHQHVPSVSLSPSSLMFPDLALFHDRRCRLVKSASARICLGTSISRDCCEFGQGLCIDVTATRTFELANIISSIQAARSHLRLFLFRNTSAMRSVLLLLALSLASLASQQVATAESDEEGCRSSNGLRSMIENRYTHAPSALLGP